MRGGYNSYYQVLNAKNYGIPQNRERVFTVSIRADVDTGDFTFPTPIPLELKLKDMLEDNVDEKYYLSDSMINYISASGTENFKNHDSKINLDVARPLTTIQNKRAGTTNYLSEDLPSNYDLSLRIKTANKKGYDEAKVGDSVSLAHPNSTTRRGRVGHQVSQTIDTTATLGVVVNDN